MVVWILIGLGLVICAVCISSMTNKGQSDHTVHTHPPLPPRTDVATTSSRIIQTQARTNTSSITKPLPSRRPSPLVTANVPQRVAGTGPRGLTPSQFPCCPYDKQRNMPSKQVIYWDSGASCYCCSRGHKFKINGKPL